MTKIETQEQFRRTVQALAETDGLIAKERRYSKQFQKAAYIASLESHANKLSQMLSQYWADR
jgi:hypothetical protein